MIVAAFREPLIPLAAGIFVDSLYYAPELGSFPLFTVYGGAVTVIAYFVRSRLRGGIIG